MCDFLVYVGLFLSLIKFLLGEKKKQKKTVFAEPRDEKISVLFLSFHPIHAIVSGPFVTDFHAFGDSRHLIELCALGRGVERGEYGRPDRWTSQGKSLPLRFPKCPPLGASRRT